MACRISSLLALAFLQACAHAPTLEDTLALFANGRDGEVVSACEEELRRWREVDPQVTSQLAAAQADVDAVIAAEEPLLAEGERLDAPAAEEESRVVALLRENGLDAVAERGSGLRRLADDLFSDSPLRIVRATEEVGGMAIRRLVPHVIVNVFSPRPLAGDAGPLAPHPAEVRILTVKARSVDAVRRVLAPTAAPAAPPPAP